MTASETLRSPQLVPCKPWWSAHLPSEWLARSAVHKAGEDIDGLTAGAEVVRFVRSGWVLRSRLLTDGRRQVMELLLPGDHLPLRPAYRADGLSALNRCEVVCVPAAAVRDARDRSPDLDSMLRTAEERRTSILNERIVTLGQRTALERTAHLFCELLHRLGEGGPAAACELPMVQADLADLLGVSVVHTNRTLQTLRQMALVEVGRGSLHAVNYDMLAKLAGFSPNYLS